ncbi:MAG: hypothetical protein ACM3ZE_19975 [Myxococcales bacterium]
MVRVTEYSFRTCFRILTAIPLVIGCGQGATDDSVSRGAVAGVPGAQPDPSRHPATGGGTAGSSNAGSVAGVAGSTVARYSAPSARVDVTSRCIVSADCPSGTHCDLGECVQLCNSALPCDANLACSKRGRCLSNNTPDADPSPSGEFKGTFAATTSVKVLSEKDTALPIVLSSSSKTAVRYRVEVEGPHLSVGVPRGEFTGTGTVTINVDGSKVVNQDVAGSVRIFTELGEANISADLHAGLSGMYRGALSYNDGHVRLGDARVRIALSESSAGILAWIDPSASLLFPEAPANGMVAATGAGAITGQILTLTVSQRIPKAFGAERNHLGRDIGRQLTLRVKPTIGGGWRGTFEERISGLFVQPVTTTGTIMLAYEGRNGMTPLVPGSAQPSVTLGTGDLSRTIPGWGDCATVLDRSGVCPDVPWANADERTRAKCLGESLYEQHVLPLFDAHAGASPVAYSQLAAECAESLNATSVDAVDAQAAAHCGVVPLVECGVQLAAQSNVSDTDADTGAALNKLVDGAINPPMLVARERMMQALDSAIAGLLKVQQERAAYDDAATALNRAVQWIYQPTVLEGLRKLTPTTAAGATGTETSATPPFVDYPAARAMSKLLRTLRDLDAERTRLNALALLDSTDGRRAVAQSSAVEALLEGVALNALFERWAPVPDTVGAESSGLLGPYDAAFGAALQGTGVFGVPDSFVPFVFDPKDSLKGKNNFEQMLSIADGQIGLYSELESTYVEASKATREADYNLANQAQQLKAQYDDRLKLLCGKNFDVQSAENSLDVSACGATGGQVAGVRAQITSGELAVKAAETQLQAMRDKIAIDWRTMKEKFQLHDENLGFIDAQGRQFEKITWKEGAINTAQAVLTSLNSANIGNGFAPAALAVPMGILEAQKALLAVERQDLQTAQQMHFERQAQAAEEIEAQANIKKQYIDLAQFRVHIQQSVLDTMLAQTNLASSLAEAQVALEERADALRVGQINPAKNPLFRLVRNDVAVKLFGARARAQKHLFLAGRALEYELNQAIPDVTKAALVTRSAKQMSALKACLWSIAKTASTPQSYVRLVSVRKMLGITSARKDPCTGEVSTEAQQFQRVLLENANLDGKGGVTLRFATDLMPGNNLWSTDVCDDRITGIRANLVGDFLGDNEAQVNLALSGTAILHDCAGENINTWSLGDDVVEGLGNTLAVIQAGANDFGKAALNTSLWGQSVARAQWVLTIPGPNAAPTNRDVNLNSLEDIVLEVTHEARPTKGPQWSTLDLSCLGQVM